MTTAHSSGWVGSLLARCTFPPPGTAVRCGLSGGADSTALVALAVAAGNVVTAVHVDHGLRDTTADRTAVTATCDQLGVVLEVVETAVEPGANLEARARAARWEILGPAALVGHTADDRAETVLLHLLRGGGLDALAAMDPANRPLLGLRRADTVDVCERMGLSAVADPTNDDRRFLRNRVRAELLPLMDDIAGRDVAAVLARQAQLATDEAALLDDLAEAVDVTDAATLASAHPALARRAVRAWLRPRLPGGYVPSADAVERVLAVARGEAVAAEVEGGLRVARTAGRLRVEPPS